MPTSIDWPGWSCEDGPALARYIVPDALTRHVQLPAASGESHLTRLREIWQRLHDVGIGYAFERAGSAQQAQPIRTPAELLVAPRNGTCLDLALLLAGACRHGGLPAAVLVLDPASGGRSRHALVAVLTGSR